jgi:pimeloyl-ACP methyl ester carboxylesterase
VIDMSDWTPPPTHQVSTRDGRVLTYCLYGPDGGRPTIAHEGTPGTRLWGAEAIGLLERCDVQALVYDRPGYGGSTRQAGRSIADAVDDVALLADTMGWERFGVSGVSGGGPHALATAVRLPDRVTRCAAVVCPAPYVADGGDGPDGLAAESFLAGMSPGNIAEFTAAMRGEAAYRPIVERLGQEAMANAERNDPQWLPDYDLPESDLAEIRRLRAQPSPGRLERARALWLDSTDGWIDDLIAAVRPWGFDLAELRVPVTLWYGRDDVLCPRNHTEWLLAHVPGVEGRPLAGGHFLADDTIVELLRWVGGLDAPPAA